MSNPGPGRRRHSATGPSCSSRLLTLFNQSSMSATALSISTYVDLRQIGNRRKMWAWYFAGAAGCGSLRLRFERLLVTLYIGIQECGIFPLRYARQQRLNRVLDIAHHAEIDRVAPADVGRVDVDLDDL